MSQIHVTKSQFEYQMSASNLVTTREAFRNEEAVAPLYYTDDTWDYESEPWESCTLRPVNEDGTLGDEIETFYGALVPYMGKDIEVVRQVSYIVKVKS